MKKIIFIAICFFSSMSFASFKIKVVNQAGEPLANTVITVARSKPLLPQPVSSNHYAVMDQVNKQFSPSVLVVSQGEKVLFPNSDNIRHHVYSFSKPKPFEIKLFKGLSSKPILFDRSGIVVLGCNIHDAMVGYIYVSNEDEETFLTNALGEAVLASRPEKINVWHANLSLSNNKQESIALPKDDAITNYTVKLTLIKKATSNKKSFKFKSFGDR